MKKVSITACIPCYNNAQTLSAVIDSVLSQKHKIDEIIVIDDGSSDASKIIAESKINKVYANKTNMGRGFTRKKAVESASSDLILFCDATNILPVNFLDEAVCFLGDSTVAAVSGRINNHPSITGVISRWRGRHLFKESESYERESILVSSLTTYGTLMRRGAIKEVGNFDASLKHSEDIELGRRLIKAGYSLLGIPSLATYSIRPDTLTSVLERYWRWYGGIDEGMGILDYIQSIKASFRPMIQQDIKSRDFASVLISFLCPHYGYLRAKHHEFFSK
ncbi:MAG: glycosyltransferase [Opitutales bacterium]|nr:glycosyltransferase [Opitutales bacterium]